MLPPLHIRPIRPQDKALLADGHAHLSPQSARARFLTAKPKLSGSELRYLTEVDGYDHVALVVIESTFPPRMVGVARFIRDPEHPEAAEAAIVIADHLQGQGLGRRLGLELADAARARGVVRFTATMLSENEAAHRLFAAISRRLHSEHHAGVRELVAELAA